MLNRKYLNQYHIKLIKLIDSSDFNIKEKEYRKIKLNKLFREMLKQEQINNHYISLAHEIKSYKFLKQFGIIQIALDSNNEEGPDFTLGEYKIECVSCSPGKITEKLEKYRLTDYRKSGVFDYNKELEILLPRITTALDEKSRKFSNYISKRHYKR